MEQKDQRICQIAKGSKRRESRDNGKIQLGRKARKSCQIGIISYPRSLKRQWPPKLSYTSGSQTSISSFSQYTRPTFPWKLLFSLSRTTSSWYSYYVLDLSAVFDTIDHKIILDRLNEWFGLYGVALDWVVSCLKHHFHQSKSHPLGPIHSKSFLVSPRVQCLDHSCLSCVILVQSCPKPSISNTTYTLMTHRSTTPSTCPVQTILSKIIKTPQSQSKTGCTKTS